MSDELRGQDVLAGDVRGEDVRGEGVRGEGVRGEDDRGEDVRVYVNERGISVPAGSTVLDAVRVLFPDDSADIEQGRSRLTDSRGLPADEKQPAVAGSIYRVIAVRERATGAA